MTRLFERFAALLIVLGLAVPLQAVARDDVSTAPRISMAEFEKLLNADGVMVIDVRDGVSYGAGHIPGAILMPLDTLPRHVTELRAATKPIVAYCA
jgi:predicted sulfurtransferase